MRLGETPLIAAVLERLSPQLPQSRIAVSANGDAARFAAYGLPVLPDGRFAGRGPLAGVAAGLAWAHAIGAGALLTIPVDTPCFPSDLLARLTPAPAVAVWRGRQHHLAATWAPEFLPELIAFLNRPGPKKVRDALARAGARQVAFEGASDPFVNINTLEDLQAAVTFLKKSNQKTLGLSQIWAL